MKENSSRTALIFAFGALGGAVLTWTLTFLLQPGRRREKELANSARLAASATNQTPHVGTESKERTIPQELRNEQISRHALYFGAEGMEALRKARVCLVGVGGVGSHAACSLARSGLGHLRVIDFDQVSLSSLNRHACATLEDVGRSKVTVLAKFLRQICPDPNYLHLEPVNEMYTKDTGPRLLEIDDGPWSVVIDAIDDIPTKAQLIADCLQSNIRIVSCMGAGGKADVTRLHVSDLRGAAKDPLATKLRNYLKKIIPAELDPTYLDDMDRLAIVFSSEKTVVGLADFTEDQKDQGVHHFGAVDGMRIRIIPVLATMPAVMGQALAALTLTEIGGKPFQPVTGERVSRNVRNKLYQKLMNRENKLMKQYAGEYLEGEGGMVDNGRIWVGPLEVDDDDIEFLLELWRNRCSITGKRLGTVLALVRWDMQKPSSCENLVLLSTHALNTFETTGRNGVDPVVRRRIEQRLLSSLS